MIAAGVVLDIDRNFVFLLDRKSTFNFILKDNLITAWRECVFIFFIYFFFQYNFLLMDN